MKPKFVFFGHDRFSALTLEKLIQLNLEPITIVDLPGKPQGRKQKIISSPVQKMAEKHGLSLIFYDKKKPDLILSELKKKSPQLAVLASFGAIIPQRVIDFFPRGILVVHPSLLPKYRGTSPARQAILDGLNETGVTVILMDKKMDHGPILAQKKSSILLTDTRDSLLERLFPIGAQLVADRLEAYLENKLKPIPQNHSQVTFTKMAEKENGQIDWSLPPAQIERHIRAYTAWPGAWTTVSENSQTKRLKILKARLKNEKLILEKVQLEGKNPVSWQQFQEGHPRAVILRP